MLFAIVAAAPILSLCLVALDTKERSEASIAAAEEVKASLQLGMDLAEFELFIGSAILSEAVLAGLAEIGLGPGSLQFLTGAQEGFDEIGETLTRPRIEIEDRLTRLRFDEPDGPTASLGELRTELHQITQSWSDVIDSTDAGELNEALAARYYQEFHEVAGRAGALAMNRAHDLSARGEFEVLRDIAAVRSLIAAHAALVVELEAVSAQAFEGQFTPPRAGDWIVGLEAYATYEHEIASFEQTASSELLSRWNDFQQTPEGRDFEAARLSLAAFFAPDREAESFEPVSFLVLSFNQLVRFVDEMLSEERERIDLNVTAATQQISDDARDTYRLTFGTALVTILFLACTARLLLRPLGDLRRRAAAMTDGEENLAALGPIGPREIAQVAVAMDDVNSNLFVIGGQLDAISERRFDDAILSTRLPGAVGRSLEQSMQSAFESSLMLNRQARIDALTSLPNRLEMVERLDQVLQEASPTSAVAVVFLDLDRFKPVNDRLGHEAGDQVLIHAARRFERALLPGESLGRIGGDEFLAIATGLQSVAEGVDLAQRLVDVSSDPITVAGREIEIGMSAGVSLVTEPSKSPSQVLHEADLGLYESKRSATAVTVVTSDLTDKVRRRSETVEAFEEALGTPEVQLHLQPIVDIDTEVTVAAEGLLRWTRNGESVPPGSFIPLIESSDFIDHVGRWVLAEAARHAARIRDEIGRLIPISVNISWHHLEHGDLVGDVERALASADIEGAALCVEFTESAPPPQAQLVAGVIDELSRLGVSFWLDDFGTGYTSITQLQNLAFDAVKLDRSFVSASVAEGEGGMSQALIDIITLMHVPVIAEGIETSEELNRMRAAGARRGQGWYWSRDLPIDRFLAEAVGLSRPRSSFRG